MERVDFRDQIAKNKWKSYFLMFCVFAVVVLLGYAISFAFAPGYVFVILAISSIISIIYVLISYYNSDKIALLSVGAKKADPIKHRNYYSVVEGLTIA